VSRSCSPRQKTRSPSFRATWKLLFAMSAKRTASMLAALHIGSVMVETSRGLLASGIRTDSLAAEAVAS
jgi:hypothetical protein